jgi:hypothetical protein
MSAILVCEWDPDAFHRRVRELEAQGYVCQQETYRITAEMNPETGRIAHIYCIEMRRPDADQPPN